MLEFHVSVKSFMGGQNTLTNITLVNINSIHLNRTSEMILKYVEHLKNDIFRIHSKVLQNFSLTWFVDVLFGDACKAQRHWHIICHIWYKFLNWDPGEHFDHVLFCRDDFCKFSHRVHKHFRVFFGVPCNSVSQVMEFQLWGS